MTYKRRCLILGGGGFIGSSVADRLLEDGYSLRIFEMEGVVPYRNFDRSESVEWIAGDFQNKSDLIHALEGVDSVVHLISTLLPKASNNMPIFDIQTNVVATIGLLDAMVEKGVQKIVFSSSGGTVYGMPKMLPITEEHPTQPEVSYGICKLMIEKYLYLYSRLYQIKPVVLRISNPYGNRQRTNRAQGAVAVFLNKALNSMPIEIWGDGRIIRDYLHISDVSSAFSRALAYNGDSMVFNIGSGCGISLNELIQAIESVIGRTSEKRYLAGRSFDVPTNILDNSLAHRELQWNPQISLREGLRMVLDSMTM